MNEPGQPEHIDPPKVATISIPMWIPDSNGNQIPDNDSNGNQKNFTAEARVPSSDQLIAVRGMVVVSHEDGDVSGMFEALSDVAIAFVIPLIVDPSRGRRLLRMMLGGNVRILDAIQATFTLLGEEFVPANRSERRAADRQQPRAHRTRRGRRV